MSEQSAYDLNKERELLLNVAGGDEMAFELLVKSYADLLFTYILKLTRKETLAEDIVQEIFTQLWLTRETLTAVRNFRAFLFVISRNHALRALKNINRENTVSKEWSNLHQVLEQEDSFIDYQLGLVEQAICQLSPQQRKVWVLSRKKGLKYHEIAEEMKISRETVKKYLQHATASITAYLRSRAVPALWE